MDLNEEMKQALQEEFDPLHSYYEKAGILVARPGEESSCRLAISAKGGHNAENHNHNDIGSFAVSLGKETMAGDQGGPFSYPGDYFSADAPEKYFIKGSYGHPVPLVDGVQQSTGAGARAIVLEKELTDIEARFSIDLTSAYHTPKLEKLMRTFTYNRSGNGSFCVEDKFVANAPIRFATALTTAAAWKQIDSNHLLLTVNDEKMIVSVEASGAVEFKAETIELNCPAYIRIGITLKKPSTDGHIALSMTPQYQ